MALQNKPKLARKLHINLLGKVSYYMKKNNVLGWVMAVVLTLKAATASASTFTYDFSDTFSGTSPDGSPPWLQATFTDAGLPANTVQLTLSAVSLTPKEFVSSWYFNLNPTLDPTALNFVSSSSEGSFGSPTIQTGADSFKAAGSGKYDILVTFPGSGEFGNGDSITFTITGISGLNAADFAFLSAPAGGSGPYSSAAQIISGDEGGWVDPASVLHASAFVSELSVPDTTSTLGLAGILLLGLAVWHFGTRLRVRA